MNTKHLKARILDLALQGKLVENSRIPNDLNSRIPTDFNPPFGIPNSWAWVKLGDICEIILGQSPNSNEIINLNSSQNYLEFHQGKIYFTDKIISKSNQAVKIANKTAQENSILLCVRAPVGIVNITDRKLAIGRGLCSIKPKKDNLFFIFFALQSLKYIFDDKATGTTFKAVTGQIVKEFYIPLPPLNEQERIVKKIDELFSQIDILETSKQNLLKNIKHTKTRILDLALQGKLVKNSRIPNDLNSRIPSDFNPPFEIPNSWEWVKLGDICEITSSKRILKSEYVKKQKGRTEYYVQKNTLLVCSSFDDFFSCHFFN